MNEILADPIVCLLEIKFNSHQTRIGFLRLETVKNLLNNDLILGNPSVGDECRLRWRYNFVKMGSELCHQELGYDFVNYIVEAYGPKMIYSSGVRNFGNMDNEKAIYLPRHGPSDEEGCDSIDDAVVDGWPELLIEYGRETVWKRVDLISS